MTRNFIWAARCRCIILSLGIIIMSCATEKDYLVTFHTEYGDMKAVLYDATPQHKKNFLQLAEAGRYDSTLFHRVIPGFMVQGGDLTTKPSPTEEDKQLYTIPAEFVDTLYHKKGALSAARQGDHINPEKASSGTQFYIVQGSVFSEKELTTDMDKLGKGIQTLIQNDDDYADLEQELITLYNSGDFAAYTERLLELKPIVEDALNINVDKEYSQERLKAYTTIGGAPHLDDTYTVFGQIVDGLNVIDSIAAQRTGPADRPVEDIYMTVDVEEVRKKDIIKKYDIDY